jgi:hypothetical protein
MTQGEWAMKTHHVLRDVVVGFQLVAGLCTAALASDSADYYWQRQMLFEPSDQQLQLEDRGQVFIYQGIKSADIDLAMDSHYDRIDNMMFVNTVWTNEGGEPIIDPYTGNPVVDDDC